MIRKGSLVINSLMTIIEEVFGLQLYQNKINDKIDKYEEPLYRIIAQAIITFLKKVCKNRFLVSSFETFVIRYVVVVVDAYSYCSAFCHYLSLQHEKIVYVVVSTYILGVLLEEKVRKRDVS